jgi:hypothetical protein
MSKHLFKRLVTYQPKPEISKSEKPKREFEVCSTIVDLNEISAVLQDTKIIFDDDDRAKQAWLADKGLILATILLKNGRLLPNILVPKMEYFGIILGDVTF